MKAKGLRISDGTAEKIGEVLTNMIESCTKDWHQPWVSNKAGYPQSYSTKKEYNGINGFLLALLQMKNGYKTSLYLTMNHITHLGLTLNKAEVEKNGEKKMEAEKPFPVFFWKRSMKQGEKWLTEDEIASLTNEEREDCKLSFLLKTYNVWNIDQTNFAEVLPEKYAELTGKKAGEQKMVEDFYDGVLEYEIEGGEWICPIKQTNDGDAYYSVSKAEIVLPMRKAFKTQSAFYGTALHEMTHSTMKVLKRNPKGGFGSKEYAKEELIAELTSAIFLNDLGVEKYIKEDSIPYATSWVKVLKDKDAVKLLMDDIMKAVAYQKKQYAKAEAKLAMKKKD